jgi:hypothetical protein
MKRSVLARLGMTIFLTVFFTISGTVFAQEKVSEHAAFSAKPLTVSGKVSADGKTFLTDIDSEWLVSNADVLKGHEGRAVRVKCYVDTEKSSMKILSVKRDDESNYAARNTFSAVGR